MRTLNDRFLDDLKKGVLAPLTDTVKSDTSLCLELRGDYINVYYRGGNLMKVEQSAEGYSVSFDPNYFKVGSKKGFFRTEKLPHLPKGEILDKEDIAKWLDASPKLKQAIDRYISKIKKDEREFQQRILRDNNFGSIARSTDYYICDIEYRSEYGQFDMVAVHWPSEPGVRKNPHVGGSFSSRSNTVTVHWTALRGSILISGM